jgi:hypothetical protein
MLDLSIDPNRPLVEQLAAQIAECRAAGLGLWHWDGEHWTDLTCAAHETQHSQYPNLPVETQPTQTQH